MLKLSCRNTSLKKNIEFLKRTTLTLRKPEVTPDKTHETDSTKQESRLATPIGLISIEHQRHDNREDDRRGSLYCCGHSNRLFSKTSGGDLGNDDKTDGTNCHLVHKGPDIHQRGSGPDSSTGGAGDTDESDDKEQSRHDCHTSIVDGASTKFELCNLLVKALKDYGDDTYPVQ